MERVHATHKASKCALEDFISSMPDNVITNILDRLPIQDAVKTGMLSRDWRSKWTLLTQLIFDENFFHFLPNHFEGKHITRLLLHLKGPIRKFDLSFMSGMLEPQVLNYDEIYQWVLFLSKKGIEELTINNYSGGPLKLPTQLYSRMELKHLELFECCVPNLHSFRSFPNLLSLELFKVTFQSCTFWEFIARCPLLEILKVDSETANEMKLIEIAKVRNIKTLYLSFGGTDEATTTITSSNIFQLTSLPKLEELTLNFECCKLLAEANAKKKVPAAFLCLKTLTLYGLSFRDNVMVSFIVEMICGSPNLQMLVTRASHRLRILPWERCSLDLDSNTMGLLQLQSVVFQSVVFEYFPCSENELSLIKFILARSPLLKNISIRLINRPRSDDETQRVKYNWEFARKLLKLHRASPTAEIDFLEWVPNPTPARTENFVVDLCSMYELAYVKHSSDIKKTIIWIALVAPDGLDGSSRELLIIGLLCRIMEPVHGAHKASKCALNVITNILDRLPIQDAVKTSMLSRDWMSKWTLLTQLIFNEDFFRYFPNHFEGKHITRLLLHLKGPIRKFELSFITRMLDRQVLNYDEIYHWVLFLSRKGIEELTINNWGGGPLKLPIQLYSRMELKHLELYECCVPNLHSVWNKTKTITSFDIFQLTSLPKLEELTLDFENCKLLAEAVAKKKVPATFLCLKTLYLKEVEFSNTVMVSFIAEMICRSPYLQMLKIKASFMRSVLPALPCSLNLDCNTMGQLQLRNVVLDYFRGSDNEVCLIKFILACSPLLKKTAIRLDPLAVSPAPDGTRKPKISWELTKKLLKLHRASPTAEIDFYD
ncbi:putative F-box-like domain superfamily protein [Tanacetum coccineum]